jgi:RNA polymerase sigma-70 factor (ECF subfamily)
MSAIEAERSLGGEPSAASAVPLHLRPAYAPDPEVGDDLVRIGRIASGDERAFAELYDRHSAVVLGLLVRILGDRSEAEEVVQEAFLQAWRQADRYRAELATPRGWLLMLARSRALDRLRANRSRLAREEAVAEERPEVDPAAEEQLMAGATRARVRAALGDLPTDQRRALQLAFFSGLTHSEIAAHLGEPLGTVKSRILLGMNKLRRALAP